MKIEAGDKFFVVTTPEKGSMLADILFATTFRGLALQFAGGLKADEIVGFYTEKAEAEYEAQAQMYKRAKGRYPVTHPKSGKKMWVSVPKD